MIGYITLGTNDLELASVFYDAVLGALGMKRLWSDGTIIAWGQSPDDIAFCLTRPFDGKSATAGNGTMIALKAADRAQVETVHATALSQGGRDEGKPGPRGSGGFYGGYFRDLDGNKLNAFVNT